MTVENNGDSSIDAQPTTENAFTVSSQAVESEQVSVITDSSISQNSVMLDSSISPKPKKFGGRPKGSKNFRTLQRERLGSIMKDPTDKNSGAQANGRPPVMKYDARQDLKNAARDFSNEAIFTLVKIMRDKNNSATNRMAAAAMILDRGHGKAVNQTEISVGVYDRYSNDELIRFITGQTNSLIDVTPSKKNDS